jgi:hypothetical protein
MHIKYDCVFWQGRQHASPSMTATQAPVTEFTARLENVGHKLYMGNSFPSPALHDTLHEIYCL